MAVERILALGERRQADERVDVLRGKLRNRRGERREDELALFRRPGPAGTDLINPGSVGMPLDGDPRAAWATRSDEGEFAFHRTAYDVERAATAYRAMGGGFGEFAARRIEQGSD